MSLPVDQVAGAGDLETAAGQRLVLVIRRVGPIKAVLVGPRERGVGPDVPDQRVAVSRFDKCVQSCGHPSSCPKAGPVGLNSPAIQPSATALVPCPSTESNLTGSYRGSA